MFGLGLGELFVVVLCLVIFIKPEQIPRVMRKFGQFYGRITTITRHAQQEMDRLVAEGELEERPSYSVLAPKHESHVAAPADGAASKETRTEATPDEEAR